MRETAGTLLCFFFSWRSPTKGVKQVCCELAVGRLLLGLEPGEAKQS